MTKDKIIQLTKAHLANFRIEGITFEVPESRIRQTEHGWRVTLVPSHLPDRMSPYYEELAIVEEEIAEREDINILFSTADPVARPIAA